MRIREKTAAFSARLAQSHFDSVRKELTAMRWAA